MDARKTIENMMIRYNEEKERLSNMANESDGLMAVWNLYKKIYGETPSHLNNAIEQFAKLAAMGNKVI